MITTVESGDCELEALDMSNDVHYSCNSASAFLCLSYITQNKPFAFSFESRSYVCQRFAAIFAGLMSCRFKIQDHCKVQRAICKCGSEVIKHSLICMSGRSEPVWQSFEKFSTQFLSGIILYLIWVT